MYPRLPEGLPGMHGGRDHFLVAPSGKRGAENDGTVISGMYWHARKKFLHDIVSAMIRMKTFHL